MPLSHLFFNLADQAITLLVDGVKVQSELDICRLLAVWCG
jgi:hypothetical protein